MQSCLGLQAIAVVNKPVAAGQGWKGNSFAVAIDALACITKEIAMRLRCQYRDAEALELSRHGMMARLFLGHRPRLCVFLPCQGDDKVAYESRLKGPYVDI